MAILSGIFMVVRTYHEAIVTNQPYAQRNTVVANLLRDRNSPLLIGDYWRVLPIKQVSQNRQNVMPLADCTTPRDALTSSAWQPELSSTSFAYLLTLDGSRTDYPTCTLQQVVDSFGNPDSQVIVSGSQQKPGELLLFYNAGAAVKTD
jgi:hypothetical protein